MKIYVTAICALFLCTGVANAQHKNSKAIHTSAGLKAGLNVYGINSNNNATTYDPLVSFHAGGLLHIHFAKEFAIQPEIVYSRQGAKATTAGTETRLNLDYINVPVLFQYMFGNGFRVQAGPQVGFLVNAKSTTAGNTSDIKNITNGTDFSLTLGASYVHPPSGFGVDARYNAGLSDMNKNGSTRSTHNGFQLGVFYLF